MADKVTLMYGSHTFAHSSSRVTIHACPTDGGKRTFPSEVLGAGAKRQALRAVPAAKNGYEDHGKWYRAELPSKDGVILSIQTNMSYHGAPRAASILLVRLREEANLITVNVELSKDHGATYSNLPAFTGKADVISLEEAEALGVVFPRGMRNVYFEEDEIEEDFDVAVIARGAEPTKPRPVKVGKGEDAKVVMMQQQGRRRLRVKR